MYVPTMADDPVDVILSSLKGGNDGNQEWIDTHWSKFAFLPVFIMDILLETAVYIFSVPLNYASVGRAPETYGSWFVCVCVCVCVYQISIQNGKELDTEKLQYSLTQ